jgi:hypothetical protein
VAALLGAGTPWPAFVLGAAFVSGFCTSWAQPGRKRFGVRVLDITFWPSAAWRMSHPREPRISRIAIARAGRQLLLAAGGALVAAGRSTRPARRSTRLSASSPST